MSIIISSINNWSLSLKLTNSEDTSFLRSPLFSYGLVVDLILLHLVADRNGPEGPNFAAQRVDARTHRGAVCARATKGAEGSGG